ncbi:hypothetical protein JDV02_003254 [Purpureocillium takamizusanense]|uniref:Infection structure specific protein n=1 Tax=Purpureocillium takamizusanense TaxID=2060973 RepID=A0A9Q8QCR4_9HYPO|nr:uncharacterized protein JDV02_003254 [Purpureocillium takamizusanense]UNI16857.1 hypothetical protein JDV02_003254 [Purpureocillium takamizusanense]
MQAKLLVLLSALAASTSAHVNYHGAVAAREAAAVAPVLAPRATGNDAECQSAVISAGTSIPTPPPEVLSAIQANTQTADPCKFSTPASLSKEFASYSSQLESWASKNKDILTKCSALASLNTISAASCKATGAAASTSKTNGVVAARETGVAVAAMAAAGIAAIAL